MQGNMFIKKSMYSPDCNRHRKSRFDSGRLIAPTELASGDPFPISIGEIQVSTLTSL